MKSGTFPHATSMPTLRVPPTEDHDGADSVRMATRLVLRRVLLEPRRSETVLDDHLRLTCDIARRHGLLAEQLLIIVKETWRDLPERRLLPHENAESRLADVVSACIREFYRGDGTQ